jgi:hypothetical protein
VKAALLPSANEEILSLRVALLAAVFSWDLTGGTSLDLSRGRTTALLQWRRVDLQQPMHWGRAYLRVVVLLVATAGASHGFRFTSPFSAPAPRKPAYSLLGVRTVCAMAAAESEHVQVGGIVASLARITSLR